MVELQETGLAGQGQRGQVSLQRTHIPGHLGGTHFMEELLDTLEHAPEPTWRLGKGSKPTARFLV